jgi:hypothetical protein
LNPNKKFNNATNPSSNYKLIRMLHYPDSATIGKSFDDHNINGLAALQAHD